MKREEGISDISELVRATAVDLVKKHDLDEIVGLMVSNGIDNDVAERAILLIPSAFAREYYEPCGITFPDTFLAGLGEQSIELQYENEPIYQHARALARQWIAESRQSVVMRVLEWSAEAKSIRESIERGLTPKRIGKVHHGFTA
jgi:hypothetical protein